MAYEMRISDWSSDVCSSDLQWQETGRIRVVILKARQLGFSTVVGAFLYWWISQHKATKGIVVTHKADATNALFDMTKRRSEEHTSELQLMRISYAVFCLKKTNTIYKLTYLSHA